MFEYFEVPGYYTAISSVMALYYYAFSSNGDMNDLTGLVFDLGYERSHIVPVFEAYTLPHSVQKIDKGGKHITEYSMNRNVHVELIDPHAII